jgi:hypothetical protein
VRRTRVARKSPELARLRHADGPWKGLLVGEDQKWGITGQNGANDPLQACPIMGGQGSRSQPGEKLRLLSCEFFR